MTNDLFAAPVYVDIDSAATGAETLRHWSLPGLQLELKPSGHYAFTPVYAFLMRYQGTWQKVNGQLILQTSDGAKASVQPGVWVVTPAGDSLLLRFRSH